MTPKTDTQKHTPKLEAIQEKTPVFKIMADNSLDAILLIDLTPETLYANRAAYELFGYDYTAQELVGQSGFIYWVEADLPLFNETILPQILAGGWNGETRQRHKDGTAFDTWAVASPVYDDQSQLVGLSITLRDITTQKQAEKDLAETKALMEAVVDQSPVPIVVISAHDMILRMENPAARKHLGIEDEASKVGCSLSEIKATWQNFDTNGNLVSNTESPLAKAAQGVELRGVESMIERKDGSTRWNILDSVPIYNKEGQRIAGMIIFPDITERKLAEAERDKLQQKIIEAQQHAIAELSTPVIPIMDRIIVLPLVGSIDSLRARDVTRNLLAGITQHRAKVVILDVTGVSIMDTGIVNHLNKTIQAARLKGAQTIVTGMSDAVAEAIVDLGIDWSGVTTLSDLQTGLMAALHSLGIRLTQ